MPHEDGCAISIALHHDRHALAILYSPACLTGNAGGLRQGWPRAPLAPDTDWSLRGWGHRSDKGVTMPGRGRVTPGSAADSPAPLGTARLDIGISDASYWASVPEPVWECRIGGYQVLKKWLSYRDHSIIHRPLTPDEVAHIQATARRIAAILLLGPALDASYAACAGA